MEVFFLLEEIETGAMARKNENGEDAGFSNEGDSHMKQS
jgi:hypothetical protein